LTTTNSFGNEQQPTPNKTHKFDCVGCDRAIACKELYANDLLCLKEVEAYRERELK